MTLEPDKRHYTYTLAYPESMGGYVFYVGKGTGARIDWHKQEARKSQPHKKTNVFNIDTIRKIWAQDEQVVKTQAAFFESHEDAYLYELALITLMKPYGHLTNVNYGGQWQSWKERQAAKEAHRKTSEVKAELHLDLNARAPFGDTRSKLRVAAQKRFARTACKEQDLFG